MSRRSVRILAVLVVSAAALWFGGRALWNTLVDLRDRARIHHGHP